MILDMVLVACDLSQVALEEAFKKCYDSEDKTLVVSTANIQVARKLTTFTDIKFLVDTDLPRDAWYVKTKWFGVFSPGA